MTNLIWLLKNMGAIKKTASEMHVALLLSQCLYLAVCCCTWLYLALPGFSWMYLAVLGCSCIGGMDWM